MKIGELAKRSGLATSTIRFYESKGLLKSVARQSNGYREYPSDAAAVLAVIVNAQQAGFKLDEIARILPANAVSWQHGELIATLEQKINDIEALELRLAHNKAQLRSLVDLINSKPEGMACSDNAVRVLDSVGLGNDKNIDN
jgi:DNA-binding transcriptional MerR regulator